MRSSKLILIACALLLGLAGCASQPERAGASDFERARAAYLAEDFEQAYPLMQQAALGGNAHAQYTLGYMLYNGQGVVPDIGKALEWIRAAAAKGEPRALEALGRLAAAATQAPDEPAQAPTR